MSNSISPLDAAQSYRQRGWRVIELHRVGPDGRTCSCRQGGNCGSAGKHPKNNEWQKAAPLSGADIQAVFDVDRAPNIGLATGAESGFWVLDLDPKDDGVENFRALLAEHGGEFPLTFTVQTGSGGYHYYFAMPEGVEVRNTQSKLAKGVDTRGTGGQVVAAPSRTSKGVYTVVRDLAPVYAPSWLIDLICKDQTAHEVLTAEDLPKPEDIPAAEWDRLNTYARRVIDAELARLDRLAVTGWEGEPWDATTFQAACSLIEIANSPWNAYSLGQAEQDVLRHAPRDHDGFDDWKVKQKFASARERVGDKARPIPESRQQTMTDDLFDGPDVQDRSTPNPTEGDGADREPRRRSPEIYFDKKDLNAELLARDILEMGPLGQSSENEEWWSFQDGVWKLDRRVVRRRTKQLLGYRLKRHHAPEVAEYLTFEDAVYEITADPHPQWMNFRNGMLDWQTGELVEHHPDFRSTVQFPLEWKPDATCEAFEAFLADVLHPDYIDLAWEMIGYLMYSGNPLQVAFLLYGTGGNGKGTLTRVIQDILGKDNIANEPLDRLNSNNFALINLMGKIANIAGDIDATYQESTAAFKRLTGEDTLTGERKYADPQPFRNWAVPLFSANKIPGSSDVTEGYLRRWVVLHFHKRIAKPRPGLSDVLSMELEGIAAKAVMALRRLMARDGGRGAFELTGEALKGQDEFARSIDQVRQWVASGEVQQAPEHYQSLRSLYDAYCLWAQHSNRGRINEQEFSHRLEGAGYECKSVGGAPHHVGLRVAFTKQPASSEFF